MLCLSPRAHADRGAPDIPSGVSVADAGRVFRAVCILLFVSSASATILICRAMADMGEVPMAGGWSMSTTWTPLCGGSWPAAAGAFLGMWATMMTAMMLPSLAPALWQLRESAAAAGGTRPGLFAATAGLGYLSIWAAFGLVVFIGGATLLEAALRWSQLARAVPFTTGLVIIAAGLFQMSRWKLALLGQCRQVSSHGTGPVAAIGQGLRLGLACSASCAGLTALLLAGGVMDLRAMVIVALAITAERLGSAGERIAGATGGLMLGAGVIQLTQAFWLL
jgi:predicted metal-binding membrane protein